MTVSACIILKSSLIAPAFFNSVCWLIESVYALKNTSFRLQSVMMSVRARARFLTECCHCLHLSDVNIRYPMWSQGSGGIMAWSTDSADQGSGLWV
jgi:hypothetical protein